jgi:hypothetical protein
MAFALSLLLDDVAQTAAMDHAQTLFFQLKGEFEI